jgi:cyclopropane fatty-acyl-phospholipid synthase-like methyltransferase
MTRNFSTTDINDHYEQRHALRAGIFGERPYANYGYWTSPDMTIEEACNALTDLMAEEMALQGEDQVLEVGCGYGASALHLAKGRGPASILGIDATQVRVREGNALMQEHGVDEIVQLQVGDATALDFAPASFTKVMAIECAFHFNTRQKFFFEAYRVLRPGGMLVMTDITPANDVDLAEWTNGDVRAFLGADAKFICDDNIYSQETYEQHLRGAGFDPVTLYSIKDRVIVQFGDHLERVASNSPLEARERRQAVADHFRGEYMKYGDYVVVKAVKPEDS